jgi:hypothetical protein
MRLWSLHPSHLDTRGLVALWREGLLARAVLVGATKGYRHHPQLDRFRAAPDPVAFVDDYLRHVLREATSRGYRFDATKIGAAPVEVPTQDVSAGQLAHEWHHLLTKLQSRDPERWRQQRSLSPRCHDSFRVVPGGVAPWERGG